jgi:hypothetical protein
LPSERVAWHPTSLNTWHSILIVAVASGGVERLADALLSAAIDDDELRDAVSAFRDHPPAPGEVRLDDAAPFHPRWLILTGAVPVAVAGITLAVVLGAARRHGKPAPPAPAEATAVTAPAPAASFDLTVRLHVDGAAGCPIADGGLQVDIGDYHVTAPIASPACTAELHAIPGEYARLDDSPTIVGAPFRVSGILPLVAGSVDLNAVPIAPPAPAAPSAAPAKPARTCGVLPGCASCCQLRDTGTWKCCDHEASPRCCN